MIFLYKLAALVCIGLGLIGVVLPGLPTVPFILLAAWFGSKGSPRLEAWLVNHKRFGPHVHNWRTHRSVPRRAKWLSSIFMSFSTVIIWVSSAHLSLKIVIPFCMFIVSIWLWHLKDSNNY